MHKTGRGARLGLDADMFGNRPICHPKQQDITWIFDPRFLDKKATGLSARKNRSDAACLRTPEDLVNLDVQPHGQTVLENQKRTA